MTIAMHPDPEKKKNKSLPILVTELPEIYQPIFGHPELSAKVSRSSDDRLAHILAAHDALEAMLKRPIRVLDLGCSQGFFSHHLASRGATVHGIDLLNANIAVCRALADERGDAISIFETKTIDDTLEKLKPGEYDLVLGLSVFHHLIDEKGLEHVREIYRGLARKTLACLFEFGLAEEPVYWGPSQPASPRQQLEDFAFVHEISQSETHLSQIRRPLYFASNACWFFGKIAGVFDRWTMVSNKSAGDTHEGTRRFFFGNKFLIKQLRLDHAVRGHYNDQEWRNEIELLRAPPADLDLPKLIEFGKNSADAWLVRECLPGESLDRKLAKHATDYDPHLVLRDVLQQLVRFEAYGLYHNNVRTWNVLINSEGRAFLIDYGAITNQRADVAWPYDVFLAFLVFTHELICARTANPFPRSPWLDPDALPEPYRRVVWAMLRSPKEDWSFARLGEMLAKNGEGADYGTASAGISAIIRSLQKEFETHLQHIAFVENRYKEQHDVVENLSMSLQASNAALGQTASTLATASAALIDEIARKNDLSIQHDIELSQKDDQLSKIEVWAKTLEGSANQLKADVAARDRDLVVTHSRMVERERELESARSHVAGLSETLTQNGAWAASLEADLIAKNARLQAIHASYSWRLTAPIRGISRAARSMAVGVRAWITFKPASRPRRMARCAAKPLFDFVKYRPRLLALAKTILLLAPPLRQRLQAATDPMRPFITSIVPPRWSGAIEHIPQPYDVGLAYNRLLHAANCVDKPEVLESQTDASKPRLAYISPLPPEKSGIADFSAQFLPSLSQYYRIDVIAPQATVTAPWVITNCAIRDITWFEQNAHSYDRILYHFGNSPFHSHMFALLEKIPGIVALHDFFLGNILGHLELSGGWGDYWTKTLAHSHGYPALESRLTPDNIPKTIESYPANFSVLDKAQGIIVHSEYARSLCAFFYPAYNADNWSVLPLAKAPSLVRLEEKSARSDLALAEDAFVICSFGFVQGTKLSQRVLDAWLSSPLATDPNCHLIFVGDAVKGPYTEGLERTVASSHASDRIKITGFASSDTYEAYLQSADIAVQLRTQSRGETSAAVLDCLAHGIPTIINANGSMDEISKDAVICLPDAFGDDQLVKALTDLWKSEKLRATIGEKARTFIAERHAPDQVAKKYFHAIEEFTSAAPVIDSLPSLIQYARNNALDTAEPDSILSHARKLRRRSPISRAAKKLLIDVSVLIRDDYRTGIQRVVRAQLIELFAAPPQGYRIEPIWLNNDFGEWRYFYARRYGLELLGYPQAAVADEPVDVGEGDVFYGADFFASGVIGAARMGLYDEWRARGVEIFFTVYDILPLTLPECFPSSAEAIHRAWLTTVARSADTLICISETVAIKTRTWLHSNVSSQPSIVSCPLGADIDASSPTVGLPADADAMLKQISSRDSFLMVGTIEPRKGYLQSLDAFEKLWLDGVDVQLIIVGARGWKGLPDDEARTIPLIVERLENHPERGSRLIWLDHVSDEYLEKIYAAAACLIAASDDEGFGLPLIEAARHNLPVLARDIPVFREVAGEHASYFRGREGSDLATAVRSWLDLRAAGSCPESSKMRWLTWKENVDQLKEILLSTTLGIGAIEVPERGHDPDG